MEQRLGMVTAEHAYLRSEPEGDNGGNTSGIEDEIFAGWTVRILEEHAQKQYLKVETHYGYTGYVDRREICGITREELLQRQDTDRFFRIRIAEADLLEQPKVQGLPMELLLRNSIVELLEKEVVQGWSLVRTACGKTGYIHTDNLKIRKDNDGYLLLEKDTERNRYFQVWNNPYEQKGKQISAPQIKEESCENAEDILREQLVRSAREYLGTQYRWGGKSSQGIDCSGLVFMSYLDQGILIYRDAQILEEYPVKEITKEQLKQGDLLFFPGHVAMYLGNEKYIHATGYVKTPYVTVNSLKETDPDYRADLAEKITGYGSIWG